MMNRREIVAVVGSVLVFPGLVEVASAQKSQHMTPDAQQPGPAADRHMLDTAAIGSLSLLASRMAANKVEDSRIRRFVEFETAEQNAIAGVLMNMNKPATQASGVQTPPSDMQLMSHLNSDGHAALDHLKGLSGVEFERAYLHLELDGHQKLLKIQNTYLAVGHDREELSFAKLAMTMIAEHLVLLHDLHAS
jgi:putative membrane protein